jgi:hypothetical protein
MPLTRKSHFANSRASTFLAGLLMILIASPATGTYEESIDMRRRALQVIQSSPVVAGGVNLGTVVLYDDPSTRRRADYLELYDGQGSLVMVSWFDRFGIQRIAVDRAFVDGAENLEGIFVPVIDDNFI